MAVLYSSIDHSDVCPLRVLVVDDEHLGRKRILDLLSKINTSDEIIIAQSGQEAIRIIGSEKPDVVLLDIRMPDCSGLDVVRRIGPHAMPITVFVTAYDQFAIKAFELAALDYLLKPFEDARFFEALHRAREAVRLRASDRLRERYQTLLKQTASPRPFLSTIPIRSKSQRRFLSVEDIYYMKADGVYVEIHTQNEMVLLRRALQSLEDELDPSLFFRIHRSVIVRLSCVKELRIGSAGDHAVVLTNGRSLRLARSRRNELEKRLSSL